MRITRFSAPRRCTLTTERKRKKHFVVGFNLDAWRGPHSAGRVPHLKW
jgi:hypothetical protein